MINIWLPHIHPEVWVAVIFVIIFGFNNFNVRRYGEIEYWMTAVKVVTIVGIIFAGVILPMNASPNQRLLGTDAAGNPVPCNQTASICVAPPGFNCTISFEAND
jgi:amino acid permease